MGECVHASQTNGCLLLMTAYFDRLSDRDQTGVNVKPLAEEVNEV
jgi:hypothetical protein